MKLYRSNRADRLIDPLVGVVGAQPSADPFATETIIVPSHAMGSWLTQELAVRLGVCAGFEFPFVRQFIDTLVCTLASTDVAALRAWTRDALTLRISNLLRPPSTRSAARSLDTDEVTPKPVSDAALRPLRRFLRDDTDDRKLMQLALRIADCFDRYQVHRPDLLLRWQTERTLGWQPALWQALVNEPGTGASPGPAVMQQALAKLASGELPPLPPRICLFGFSSLPPTYLQLFEALSAHVEVHLFALCPTREFFGDMAPRRRPRGTPADSDNAPPLLRSLGALAKSFQQHLEEATDYDELHGDLFVEPGEDSVLHKLQSDIVAFREPTSAPGPADDTVSIVSCHTPMREVEVLHDRLLDLFARDPSLEPQHVVVMLPDVERYAPLVEAVFERALDEPCFIPYCIADRPMRRANPVVDVFFRVLDLAVSRVAATDVLDLLALSPVTQQLQLRNVELETLTRWIEDCHIRWGVDAAHRASFDIPTFDQNTWRFGLSRMLLGYALPSQGAHMFADVLPYDEIEGLDGQLLGKLAAFCEALFDLLAQLKAPHTLLEWQQVLGSILDRLVVPDVRGSAAIRTALAGLADDATLLQFDAELGLPALRPLLERRIEAEQRDPVFSSRGVTFCGMLPMRSIPFRVVAMLGLDDGSFPRADHRPSFDETLLHPRPGDRSQRDDDRHLFLEALLASKERMLLSYVGQNSADGSPLPPCVVLGELLEVLERSFGQQSGSAWVTRHRMHPFCVDYFDRRDPRLYSYDARMCESARRMLARHEAVPRPPLLSQSLPALAPGEREVALPDLVRFFQDPCLELVRRRLGLYFDEPRAGRGDREPLALDGLDAWRVGELLVEHGLLEYDDALSHEVLGRTGLLPPGNLGALGLYLLGGSARAIVQVLRDVRRAPPAPPALVDVRIGRFRLVGRLPPRFGTVLLEHGFKRLSEGRQLRGWVHHLAANASNGEGLVTLIAGRPCERTACTAPMLQFNRMAMSTAKQELGALLELYALGHDAPLRFFPRASFAYARAIAEGKDDVRALAAARGQWLDRTRPEAQLPHLRALFRGIDPLLPGSESRTAQFTALSRQILEPLFRHRSS